MNFRREKMNKISNHSELTSTRTDVEDLETVAEPE